MRTSVGYMYVYNTIQLQAGLAMDVHYRYHLSEPSGNCGKTGLVTEKMYAQ